MKTVYLAWQDRHSRRWFPVGQISQCDAEKGGYQFNYIRGAERAKVLASFAGLPGFPEMDKEYWSSGLFPLFRYRVMNLARPDRPEYLNQLGIDVALWDELTELSVSGGHSHSDHIEIFPAIEPDDEGCFRTWSVLHGLRHTNQHGIDAAGRLNVGDSLRLAFELNNPSTEYAFLVYTNDHYPVGWLPRYLVDCMQLDNRLVVTDTTLEVIRVNVDAPLSHRLLVSFMGRLPRGFNPMRDLEDYHLSKRHESEAVCRERRMGLTLPVRKPKSSQSAMEIDVREEKQTKETELENGSSGVNIRAGDRVYIPAGALQLSLRGDGSIQVGDVFLSVDPWLPDLSASIGTSARVVEAIVRDGFPVSSICGETVNACQKSHDVRALLAHPEASRLRHMAVIDGTSAVGVLDLDKARGEINHHDPIQRLLVGDICEPLGQENCLRGNSPLIEYMLTADDRPFRMIQLANDKLGTVDVEDLQKLPVRILLFTKISHLETLLARQLCVTRPKLLDILRITAGPAASSLGSFGSGPLRRVEKLNFGDLLRKAKEDNLISIDGEEIEFLTRYRNSVAHGPGWYITRRKEVTAFVNCVKRISDLINELDALSG